MQKTTETDLNNLMFAIATEGLCEIRASQYEANYLIIGEEKKDNWLHGIQACKISEEKALIYFPDGIWEMNLSNGGYKKLVNTNFQDPRACVAYKGKGISFDKDAAWIFDPILGKHLKLGTGTWKHTADVCKVGNLAYVAHSDGIYEFNLDDGGYKLLKENDWGDSKKIMFYDRFLYVLHKEGIFKVDIVSEEFSRVGDSKWGGMIRNVAINFGSDFYAFYHDKIYWGSLLNGSFSVVNSNSWKGTVGVFEASDIPFPLTGGQWEKIFEVRDPLAEHVQEISYTMGTSKTDGTEISNSLSIRLEMTMKASMGVGSIGAEKSATIGAEVTTQLTKTTSETFSQNVKKTRKITIFPGDSVACWQYVFNGQMDGVG